MNIQNLVVSRLILRRTLGILGILLPFILALGNLIIFRNGLESSISKYYHTGMGDVFVGILFAWGLFLFSYRGYERSDSDKWYELPDNFVGHLACLFAIGVAIFPTTPEEASEVASIIGIVHRVFTALLFITLAYFPLILFTKTNPNMAPTPRKLRRNRVYIGCGAIILLCIVLLAVRAVVNRLIGETSAIEDIKPIFWLEAIAVVVFGISWLVKGETLLQDPKIPA